MTDERLPPSGLLYFREAWLSQANWFIDAVNGQDSFDGLTASTALRSAAELNRRIGYRSLNQSTFVHQLSNLAETLSLEITLPNPAHRFVWVGESTAWTTVRSSTLTSQTGIVRTGASPQGQLVADTTVADWTANIGQRIRLTSGANAGATAWIVANIGGNTALTTPFLANINPLTQTAAAINNISPAGTESYVIETLPTIVGLNVRIRRGGSATSSAWALFDSIDATSGSISLYGIGVFTGAGALTRSRLPRNVSGDLSTWCVGCLFRNTVSAQVGSIRGGGSTKGSGTAANILTSVPGTTLAIRNDVLFHGSQTSVIGLVTCDTLGFGIFAADSDGLVLDALGKVQIIGTAILYGASNTNSGVEINSGGLLIYGSNVPNIFGGGAAPELDLNGVSTTWAAVAAGPGVTTANRFAGVIPET